jgi:peptide/nickel transport system substrate-binding protein
MRRFFQAVVIVLVVTFIAQGAGAAEIVIGTRTEPSIDPHYLWVGPNTAYSKHIFTTLTDRDSNSRRIPSLAVSWKAIDDKTWEFKLRKGVKFHDGSEFTAEDVIFSIKRIPNVPNSPAPYTSNVRSVAEVRALDPYTLIIKTDVVNPVLPSLFGNVVIVSKKVAEKATTADFTLGKAAIGTGPYKFFSYKPGDRYILVRNDNYWGEKPVWDRVTFRIISNDAARVASLLAGDVDVIEVVPPTEVRTLEQNKDIRVYKRPSDRVIYLVCNNIRDRSPYITDKEGKPLDINPLKDVRVRRAISKAIHREAICQQVMDGLAAPASQLIPEGWFSYNPDIKVEKYDPEGAKRLLAEAGYPNGFGLTVHGPNDRYVNDYKICQAVAQMLARIGLAMKVETLPKSIYLGRALAPKNEFALSLIGWGNSTGAESTQCLMSTIHTYDKAKGWGSWNPGNSNPELDRAMEEAAGIIDEAKREKALQEVMQLGVREQNFIPLHAEFTVVATRKGFAYVPRADQQTIATDAKPAP